MILSCIGLFDIIFISFAIILNIVSHRYLWFKNAPTLSIMLLLFSVFIGFGLIIPFVSMQFEIMEQKAGSNIGLDAHEMAYMIFIFPFYWLLGLIQFITAIWLRTDLR